MTTIKEALKQIAYFETAHSDRWAVERMRSIAKSALADIEGAGKDWLQWKPIETAPKDRGDLLVKTDKHPYFASWFDSWAYDFTGKPRSGWVIGGGGIIEPTHWLASAADLLALTPPTSQWIEREKSKS